MLEKATDPDAQIIWGHALVGAAQSPQNVNKLVHMLDNKIKFNGGWEFDQAMRWKIVTKAASHDPSGAEDRYTSSLVRFIETKFYMIFKMIFYLFFFI